ncbi:MAG: hypothetical protein A3D44_04415 [Candidatus Staskawiczbacteria bacterium RIFCSPHIGHO2_02_FULL_42_22]|uniref:Uncharacterized protein n=1 Tax=Candidatus Staskawiczbacteria bacterium RIFCSPHIGHO2_02_FULL_42_22 TaxID=1802207 RepID=A0A1G2I6T6_9BACT|nr:MAG: hypothetical protein A3D44_04415 [Candidatus Staskawiczbacteria bacterium RIFCSPHIGHO2_02_FULL_42_22]
MNESHSENSSQQNEATPTEDELITALEQELSNMAERRPERREKGDPKYRILQDLINQAKEEGFRNAYNSLENYQKHVIISRLENQEFSHRVNYTDEGHIRSPIPYNFIKGLSEELYGNTEGHVDVDKKGELEKKIQEVYKQEGYHQ